MTVVPYPFKPEYTEEETLLRQAQWNREGASRGDTAATSSDQQNQDTSLWNLWSVFAAINGTFWRRCWRSQSREAIQWMNLHVWQAILMKIGHPFWCCAQWWLFPALKNNRASRSCIGRTKNGDVIIRHMLASYLATSMKNSDRKMATNLVRIVLKDITLKI